MTQPRLPLWKVVFVDWHGVLSHHPFWFSVLDGRRDNVRHALEERLRHIFDGRPELARDWMRGRARTDELFAPVVDAFGSRHRDDFLLRRIIQDCLAMPLEPVLAGTLAEVAGRVRVVVATDNTADFERAFHLARRRPAERKRPENLRQLAPLVDDLICSSTTGVFKAEDPHTFFGPWLQSNCLGFGDALLIDDRDDNCRAFEACGGRTIRWRPDWYGQMRALTSVLAWADSDSDTIRITDARTASRSD